MERGSRSLLFAVFTVTGFAALSLQVVWMRVISLHAGVDLSSFTTVVAAFLAGIGAGSLLGGRLADRLGPNRSARAFAFANLAVGAFAWVSVWLFYDVYEIVAPSLQSVGAKFGFNAVLLLVPTTLMGLSTPLVAKAAARRIEESGTLIGRLYAANTFGAALGAAFTGWYLQGTFGFVAAVRIAGTLQVLAAVAVLLRFRSGALDDPASAVQAAPSAPADAAPAGADVAVGRARGDVVWPWFVVYGVTGAVALGLETVFFRVIDTIMRSNSYSFGHVLSLYLVLFAAGAALGSLVLRRVSVRRPELWFLWCQFTVGAAAIAGLTLVVKGGPRSPWADSIRTYFGGEGFAVGFTAVDGSAQTEVLQAFVFAPLLIMAVPVLAMGASYPFIQTLVARHPETLGRRTGTLLASNVVGNVVGTLLAGFVLIDRFGTAGTYRILGATVMCAGLVAAWMSDRSLVRRLATASLVLVVLAAGLRVLPTNELTYAAFNGVELGDLALAEDRSCATALRRLPDGTDELTINGAAQNKYPFDDFHVLVGLAPAIAHPDPKRAMALGFGIGATPYGLAADQRLDQIDSVELCGGELDLLRELGDEGAPELQRLFTDPRERFIVGDGRDVLLRAEEAHYDVVVVDTLRSQSAFSGSLYSEEFYELVRSRLAPGGILAQWDASPRVLDTVTRVFPYVVRLSVGTYYGSVFYLASDRPIEWPRAALQERLGATDLDEWFPTEGQAANLATFFAEAVPGCVRADDRSAIPADRDEGINTDLRPLDEYFLNNPVPAPPVLTSC